LITYTKPLSKLIGHFEKFPGIGPRTAQRLALFILKQPESTIRDFSKALLEAHSNIGRCKKCFNLTSEDECEICKNTERNQKLICVVAETKDLLALSGGVDSTTLAILLNKAIGNQLTCMFIDQGFMRKGEPEFLMNFFDKKFHIKVEYINARERFIAKLKGITDPELKRKIIGEEFIRVFEEESNRLGPFQYLAQGTLYPDVIESAGTNIDPKTGERIAVKIKSHHNVGGLPKDLQFKLVEPLRKLFKDEVRKLGAALGLPDEII